MLEDLVADHPVLAAFAAVLALVLSGIVLVWLWRRRAAALKRRPASPAVAPQVRSAPLPALTIDSFAPLPPRVAQSRPPKPPGAPTVVPPPEAPQACLLVVDDSAVARALLRKQFEAAGYRVDLAAHGGEALALIGSQRYAVLVTDLEMPQVNGFQLIAAVQASPATEDLPIIAITGHDELSARVHDMKGLYGIFKKPWNERELLQRVANVATLRRLVAAG